ncbi:hypothetical protein BD779DRAFT_1553994, partial [Infundibulicybe gibba]
GSRALHTTELLSPSSRRGIMSKEFISNTVLDDRVFYSTQTTFSGNVATTIGQIAVLPAGVGGGLAQQGVPTIGVGRPGDAATTIGGVSAGAWVRLGRQGGEAAATIGQTVVSVVADLTDLNRVRTDSATWSWFRNFTSAIPKLGWTAHTTGPQDVDLKQIPASANTVADLITGIIIQRTMNAMTLAAATGTMKTFETSKTENSKSFTVTAVSVKNGVLTMRTIGLEFRSTQNAVDFGGQFAAIVPGQVIDFTANQSFLDANRKDVEQKLQGDVGRYIENTPID